MSEIRLTNTKTRTKETFRPLDPSNVRMYLCGPTVYDRAHLGNARPVLVFDVLYRLLRHLYGPKHVTYVRNITDVDDKINAEAQRRKAAGASGTLEELIRERTEETVRWYHEDMKELGALAPDHEPRATEYIAPMVAMIETLIDRGHAYAAEGHVLFAVDSYAWYGALSGRSVEDMIAGARVEVAPYKRNPMDFVLWKPSGPELPGWDSPWGRGRPGWHIECSAMARELLGGAFDIHGGGVDLQFPHHENEIAQSRCAHPDEDFAQVWLHNEMLMVEGRKMSKSLGNFFTVRDLLDQGVPGEVIRFVMLMSHYRKPMDWTDAKKQQAIATLFRWRELTIGIGSESEVSEDLVAAIADDLDTPRALAVLQKFASNGRRSELKAGLNFIGLDLELGEFRELNQHVERFIGARNFLRRQRNYEWADKVRDKLGENRVVLQDTKDGDTTFSIDLTSLAMDALDREHPPRHDVQVVDFSTRPSDTELARHVSSSLSTLWDELTRRFPEVCE